MTTFIESVAGPLDVTSDIAQANKEFMASFNNGDARTMARHYTVNSRLYPPNSDVIVGPAAIEGFWNAVMNMGIKKLLLETVTAESCGNMIIEEGRYKLYVEGDLVVDQGKYIVTWEKVDGKWKLHRDIWNTSNPAPK
jgi:ketosteroid isomerase-like protein